MSTHNIYDLICIGASPNNLSVGTLGFEDNLNILILEKNKNIYWHKGMMINGCTLQNSITKDLVTLANPTSKFSLINYLHTKKDIRVYCFWHYVKMHHLIKKSVEIFINHLYSFNKNTEPMNFILVLLFLGTPFLPQLTKKILGSIFNLDDISFTRLESMHKHLSVTEEVNLQEFSLPLTHGDVLTKLIGIE